MKELHDLIRNLRQKEQELRVESRSFDIGMANRVFGTAEGVKLATDALEAAVKRLYGEDDLANLAKESIETTSHGYIKESEIFRIQLKYGVRLSGNYDFARTQEFRLFGGGKLVF